MTGRLLPAAGDARSPSSSRLRAFTRYAWTTLAVTVVVIVWGAVVRATGSGAGCGSHWPLCNGDIVPLNPSTGTIIEFVHRATSGGVMAMAFGLLLWSRRLFAAGHQVRRWAGITFVFMLVEAAIGAGIVLLELVGDNASAMRAAYVGGHLVNTLLLVGAMLTTIWWARPSAGTLRSGAMLAGPARGLTLALLALLVVASTGAVVALGDTLFPHASLAEGIAADFDATSHFLIRLRIWHPVMAVLTAIGLLVIASRDRRTGWPPRLIVIFVLTQTVLGIVNLLLLAPLSLQMVHLVMSNLLWMAVVWAWLDRRRLETPGASR
jgi:cytochrome c oxidase assembly protein subunit 15